VTVSPGTVRAAAAAAVLGCLPLTVTSSPAQAAGVPDCTEVTATDVA